MHYNVRGKSSDICNANARCTADYMIRKQVTYDHWYKKCITLKQTRDISFAYFSYFFFCNTVFTQESNSLIKSSKSKNDFFHHPPKVIFHSRPFDLEVFSEFPKKIQRKLHFLQDSAQPRYIEKTFDLASQRHIFSYNPKDRPTKKFSYFFTIELKMDLYMRHP